MIGHIGAAYREGRRDALSGKRRPRDPRRDTGQCRRFYVLGWKDERARMKRAGRLPQLEMSFPDREGAAEQNGRPQMPQDQRSHERMNPNTPEMD